MLALAATAACQEIIPEATLEVDKAEVSLAATSGEATFKVTANNAWTATADAEWVTVTPASGDASAEPAEVKVSATDNTETEARTATVTVQAGELTKTVAVTQAAAAAQEPEVSDWAVVGSFTNNWNPTAGLPLYVLDENYFVAYGVELPEAAEFKFLQGGAWGGAEVGASMSVCEPNTIQVKGTGNIKVMAAGKYDLYLAADASKFYVMTEGKTPAEATEPAPVAVTYTVAGTIKDAAWNNSAPVGLMAEEGNYLVAKDIEFVWASTLYGGENKDQVEFKIVETGSWNGFGEATGVASELNTEIAVTNGAQGNIGVTAPEGKYDVYFDKENAKVWLMNPGLKPGEIPVPESFDMELTNVLGAGVQAQYAQAVLQLASEGVTATMDYTTYQTVYTGTGVILNLTIHAEGTSTASPYIPVGEYAAGDDTTVPFVWQVTGGNEWMTWGSYVVYVVDGKPTTIKLTAGTVAVDVDGDNYVINFENENIKFNYAGPIKGISTTPAPEVPTEPTDVLDGKQYHFNWAVFGGAACVIDFGATVPGYCIIAYDLGGMDPSMAGVYAAYMGAEYTVGAADATSGVITLTLEGKSVEMPYSNLTENTIEISAEALLYEKINCTLATSKVEIQIEEQ